MKETRGQLLHHCAEANMDPATNGTSEASSVFTSLFGGRGGGSKHKYSPLGHDGEASGEAGAGASESQTQLLPGESTADESLDEESQLQQQKPRGLLYRLVWGDPNKIFVKLIMLLLMIPLFSYLAAASLWVLPCLYLDVKILNISHQTGALPTASVL